MHLLDYKSQIFIVLSRLDEINLSFFVVNIIELIAFECSDKVTLRLLLFEFHNLISASSEADAKILPLHEYCIQFILCVCAS